MRDRVISILKKHTKSGRLPGDDESLFDGGYLDSFSLPDVINELEREFQIKIPDADMNPRKFESIARIESYIGGRK